MTNASLARARRARVLARLEAHGLPVVYGGPLTVGSSCPLCPPKLGPFGTRYIAEAMVVEFTDAAAVRLRCLGAGCDQRDILKALRAERQVQRVVA